MTVQPQHPAIDFLRGLFKDGDRICFAFIDASTGQTEHEFMPEQKIGQGLVSALEKRVAAGKNAYVTLNPVKTDARGRTKGDIATAQVAYIDIDENGPSSVESVLGDAMKGTIPEPQWVVESSPGKRQIIWLLDGDVTAARQEALNKALALRYGADLACVDVNRVFRIPGFPNLKYPDKPVSSLLEPHGDGTRHKLSEFKIELELDRVAPARPPADEILLRYDMDLIEANLDAAKIEHSISRDWKGQGWMYDVECPWADAHTSGGRGAIVALHTSGAPDFFCHHNHCVDRHWSDFKDYADARIGGAPRYWSVPNHVDPVDLLAPGEDTSVVTMNGVPVGEFLPSSQPTQPAPLPTDAPENWRASFRSLKQLKAGGARFLIEDFLHEGVIYLVSPPAHLKTWLALSLCKALMTGEPFLGRFPVLAKTPVLYLVPDEMAGPFRERAEKMGLPDDETKFLVRSLSEGETLNLHHPHILEAIKMMGNPIVVCDTFINFSEAEDENSASQARPIIQDTQNLIMIGCPVVLLLHHAPKKFEEGGEISLQTCMRGSSALAGAASSVWALRRDAGLFSNGEGPEEADLVNVKPRAFSKQPKPLRIAARYKKDDGTTESYIDALGDLYLIDRGAAKDDLKQRFVTTVIAHPDISLKALAPILGVSNINKVAEIAKACDAAKYDATGKPNTRGKWVIGKPAMKIVGGVGVVVHKPATEPEEEIPETVAPEPEAQPEEKAEDVPASPQAQMFEEVQ